jgi:hypothetical protein
LFSITYQLCFACGNRKSLTHHHIPALFSIAVFIGASELRAIFQRSRASPA